MNDTIMKLMEEIVDDFIHTPFDVYLLKIIAFSISTHDPKLQAFMKELFAVAEKHRLKMIEMKGGADV